MNEPEHSKLCLLDHWTDRPFVANSSTTDG